MEALQRVKMDGFQMVISELEVEMDYCAGRSGTWKSEVCLLQAMAVTTPVVDVDTHRNKVLGVRAIGSESGFRRQNGNA
jgi:hypothetical protein